MMKNLKKGFTLIELLVVIAIIGILAAIVLASLGTARTKGKNAAIQEEMSSVRNQAEVWYSGASNYGTGYAAGLTASGGGSVLPTATCATTNGLAVSMFGAAATSNGLDGLIKKMCADGATAITAAVDAATATKYAMSAALPDAATWVCVDSNGTSKTYTAAPTITAGVTCP